MEPNESIINRIKKMLALANDKGATEGERDNAMRAAQAYLAKYNLDMAAVAGNAKTKKEYVDEAEPRNPKDAHFFGRPWARAAAASIADLCFCVYLFSTATVSKNTRHVFIGRTANSVTAALLAEYVVNSINREGRSRQRREGKVNSWFISFAWGAALAVKERVEEIKRTTGNERSVNGTPGTDLVLSSIYDTEQQANTKAVARIYPKTKINTNQGQGIKDRDGYSNGVAYGSSISLNRQV